MSAFIIPWLLLASVQLTATMSPGPAFALTVRNAIAHHRRAGIATAIGLGLGVSMHIFLVLAGASIILFKYPILYAIVKYSGATYLIYIGIKGLKSKPNQTDQINKNKKPKNKKPLSFVIQGFLTNILNPKAWIFFPAVFLQFISPETPIAILILYGLTSISIEILWFTCLAFFLTHQTIRTRFLSISHWIDRICGGLLIALGVKLIFDKGLKIVS